MASDALVEFHSRAAGVGGDDVGDDPALEPKMANDAGALSVAVTTGIYSEENFASETEDKRPTIILTGVDALLPMLRGAR